MVKNHYRWDFIGLSTDEKPTPATSEKVTDGSTFYVSDTSQLYVWCKDNWYEKVVSGGGGGTSNFNQLTNRPKYNGSTMTGSTNIPEVVRYFYKLTHDDVTHTYDDIDYVEAWKLPDGKYIIDKNDSSFEVAPYLIEDGGSYSPSDTVNNSVSPIILVTDAGSTVDVTIISTSSCLLCSVDKTTGEAIDVMPFTPPDVFEGTDGTNNGRQGLVPAPTTSDFGKFLKSDGTWDTAGGSSVNVVQTTGTSTTDVMSQNATTSLIYKSNSQSKVAFGNSPTIGSSVNTAIAIGGAEVTKTDSIAIGTNAGDKAIASGSVSLAVGAKTTASGNFSVALGAGSTASSQGQFDIGTSGLGTVGYSSSNYRLLTGLYDGQNAHDAVTVGQVNATIDTINTALSTSIPHIGA